VFETRFGRGVDANKASHIFGLTVALSRRFSPGRFSPEWLSLGGSLLCTVAGILAQGGVAGVFAVRAPRSPIEQPIAIAKK